MNIALIINYLIFIRQIMYKNITKDPTIQESIENCRNITRVRVA